MKPKSRLIFRICFYCFCAFIALSPALWLGWRALVPGIGVLGFVICAGEFVARLPRP